MMSETQKECRDRLGQFGLPLAVVPGKISPLIGLAINKFRPR